MRLEFYILYFIKMAGRKRRGKKITTRKQVEKIARQVAYKQIPLKLKTFDINNGGDTITNSTPWTVIKPLFIDYGVQNYQRNQDHIYAERCSGFFNVSVNSKTTNAVEIRELCGFYKGTSDPGGVSQANFGSTTLTTDLSKKSSRWDRDNYMITHDKSYDWMPTQVYNEGGAGEQNQPIGIWRSKMIKLNLPLYRRFEYSNTTEGGAGDAVEGLIASSNVPMGWQPFLAVQLRCPASNFTGSGGNNPSPDVDSKFTTYFKDLQ